jgi:hypothetical protein
MKNFALLIALTIPLIAQTTSPDPGAAQQPHTVEVPLLDCSGLPCLDMSTASGKTLRLVMDTAEPNSYLDMKVAQSLGANLQTLKTDDNADVSQVQQTIVPGAKIGDLPMGDFPFMVLDTTPDAAQPKQKNIAPFPADGALGFRAFENRILKIDYAHRAVRLSEPLDFEQQCPKTCTQLVVRHFGNYGPVTLTTDGFSVNGQPIRAQLDTQFTGTMLIYPDFVKKLGLKKLAKAKHKESFPYLQGGLKLAQAEGATEGYQGVQFEQDLPLYFFDSEDDHTNPVNFDATVGSGLLKHSTAVFDFKGKHFWIESASVPPPAPPQ